MMDFYKVLTNEEKTKKYSGKTVTHKEANKIIAKWLKDDNLLSYSNFMKKVQFEGIDIDKFATIINGEEVKDISCENIEWVELYEEMKSFYNKEKNNEYFSLESLLYFSNMFINWCRVKLDEEIKKYKNIKIEKEIKDSILDNIGKNLLNVYSKTLIYEYYNQNEKSFVKYNKKNFKNVDDIEKFLTRYPVIVRRIVIKTKYLLNTYLESLYRIDRDLKEIESKLDISLGKIITKIEGNLGDTHEKGKFVIKYEFESGNKIIYKPKKLYIAREFYRLIHWINMKSECEKIKIPLNYYDEEYTIETYVKAKPCESLEQIERYYKRIGELIGIIYMIQGNDFHHENIIANGEYPCLIDLETLFQQRINVEVKDIFDYLGVRVFDTIKNSCFLPSNFGLADNEGNGIDISALNYKNQKLPYKILRLVGDIDNPRFDYVSVEVKIENNVPILNGQMISYKNYIHSIEEGFKEIGEFFISHKEEVIEQLESFKGIESRQLMRDTVTYARVLEYASHPKHTLSMNNFEKMLYCMWEGNFADKRAITSEVEDLLEDDIPLFRTQIDSKDLIDSKNRRIKDYFEETSFNNVKNRIINFNEDTLNTQIDYLNEALNNSKNIIANNNRIKNDLYNINRKTIYNNKNETLETISKDIVSVVYSYSIEYNNEITYEGLLENSIKSDTSFDKGVLGIYYYLYNYNKKNYEENKVISKIVKSFSNNKFLAVASNNGVTNILEYYHIIEGYITNYFNKDLLLAKDQVRLILQRFMDEKDMKLFEIVKYMKTFSSIYNRNKVFGLKKKILLLKKKFELGVLEEGLKNLKYDSSLSIVDILECITIINSMYPDKSVDLDLDYINKLNNEYFDEILNCENIGEYTNVQYRNILKSLDSNMNNDYIEYSKLEECLLKIISSKNINENIVYELDVLTNYYLKSKNEKLKEIIDEKIKLLIEFKNLTKRYPIDEMCHFKNLSIENGLSGIGYEILRYFDNNLPSIIRFDKL